VLVRAAALAGVGLTIVVGAAFSLQGPLGVDAAYPSRVGVVGGVVLAAALAGLRRNHPFGRLGPANVFTGGRALGLALVAGVALAPQPPAPTWPLILIAGIAAAADLFDGPIARSSGLSSRFGARFDMEVDALLVLVLSVVVWRSAQVGAWVIASGLLRYVFVAAGWAVPRLNADLPPSRRRQTVCVAQILALIVALAPGLPLVVATGLSAAGLALLAWSFAVDLRWLAVGRETPPAAR
jgi:phosphatidylglycerophosphate synthase